ncbi:MAG: hypothetical protein EOP84_14575 [Verrucomicrobiaceae bacterium]|nr:MAG: hypothetical protein EOP84_14575 [Verrucomicrobiaceae bacterium]
MIEGLVQDGRFEEAKELILSSTGAGDRREVLIFSLFSKSAAPLSEALQLAGSGFQQGAERSSALRGISLSLARPEGLERIRKYLEAGHKPEEGLFWPITSGLAASLDLNKLGMGYYVDPDDSKDPVSREEMRSRFKRNEEILAQLLAANPATASKGLESYLHLTAGISPELAWESFQKSQGVLAGKGRSDIQNQIIRGLVGDSGEKALRLLSEAGSEQQMSYAMDEWLKQDSKQGRTWYEENKGEMPSTRSDALVSSFARHECSSGNVEEAKKLVDQITDPAVRRDLENRVWVTERDSLRKDVGKDPAGSLQAIINGQSKYAAYWAEEAMGTWISNDFEKAQDWYEGNWKTLPQGKSQYVAAAFANHALKQGGASTAIQWASYIQDTKIKQRIQEGIDKANGGGGQ